MFKSSKVNAKSNYFDEQISYDINVQRGNLNQLYPSDFTENERKIISSVKQFTMTSSERLVTLYRAINHIEKNNILGDIVECGVWKGGSMMIAAKRLLQLNNQNRKLYLFDTFNGMSKPTDVDINMQSLNALDIYSDETTRYEKEEWCYSSLEEVKLNLYSTQYDINNIFFIKGKVEETLPYEGIENISILRLDTDFYESTKHELINLYDKLVSGGVLIIDDYGHWNGAKKAVDEFIEENNLSIFLHRVDYTCRMAIKP